PERRPPDNTALLRNAQQRGLLTVDPTTSRYVPPTGSHIAAATAAVQPPIPNPTLRASAGAISTYAIRSEGTRNLRPLSSAIRNSPSSVFSASATCFSTSSGESALETTSSRGASLMPILTSTCDLRILLIV